MTMSDHQDSENFGYNRTWKEIEEMLWEAERKQNQHLMALRSKATHHILTKEEKIQHMRDFKGLQGVIYGLRWVLGDLKITRKKVLGDE
tara:strand:+ start:343 stop:609 length:267 start_codon:yes stop_codon:yes gene_type:complete